MNDNYDADIGGGRGYSLSFADKDSYATVQHSFTPSTQWAVNEMTMSVWIRFVGMPLGTLSSPFILLAANDPQHFGLFLNTIRIENNWIPNVELYLTGYSFFAPERNLESFSRYWTHVTVTCNLTDL